MGRFTDELFVHLKEHGYEARMVSIHHVQALEKTMGNFRKDGSLNSEFHKDRLTWFNFQVPPESLLEAKSLIILAVPRPQTRAIFNWKGQRRPLILPPTYTAYDRITEQAEKLVAEILIERGYKVAGTQLPLKLLAARSGLTQYGRNNICYVPGMGSFLQLAAVYSDMPCENDSWQEAKMMKACEECDLCGRACPSGAISGERFLLHAERCISYHNEKKGDIPFPEWMDSSWHNCVVGCMRCQKACPENRKFLQWVGEKEEFSEMETALLLRGTPQNKLPPETTRKLKNLDLTDYLNCLPRNLSVFFKP